MNFCNGYIYDAAYVYKSYRWSVIPVPRTQKAPVIPWKVYQDRIATDEEIRFWFAGTNANIGIVCGRVSGLLVVDIDPRNGGKESADRMGLYKADAPMVASGGGGTHIYFRYPDWLDNSRIRLPREYVGIDIQGTGKYVLAPPSIHPKTGKEYLWSINPSDSNLPMPGLLYQYVEPVLTRQTCITRAPFRHPTALYRARQGQRNIAAAELAGHIIGKGASLERCKEIMRLWNSENTPTMSDKELLSVINSIWRKHYGTDSRKTI